MHVFVFAVLGLGILGATLPVILELAVLTGSFLLLKRKQAPATARNTLALAVIIPAHNEELHIARTIQSLLASDAASRSPGKARIVAIAHNCSDETAERAAMAGAEVMVYDDPAARGKGFALRRGFDRVFSEGADAVLVVDADSTVSANLVDAVRDSLAAGAEAVQCRYEMSCSVENTKGHLAALAMRGFNRIRPAGRNRLGLSAGILGNGFAISKTVFEETPYQALSLVEDLEYHIHLVIAGRRVTFLEDARVSSEFPESSAGAATQRSRWEGGRFRTARQWILPLAGRIARGQLHLLEPLLDLAGLPLAYAAFLLVIALLIPMDWLRAYGFAALLLIGAHVLASARTGEDFGRDLRLLCKTPVYIAWKLRSIPNLFRGSSSSAAWIRTERAPSARKL